MIRSVNPATGEATRTLIETGETRSIDSEHKKAS